MTPIAMEQVALRQARIAKNLSTLYAFEQGRYTVQPRDVELTKTVEKVCQSIEAFAGQNGQRIEVDLRQTTFVKGVGWLIEMALYNLLDNAVQYGKKGTSIRLSARSHSGMAELSVENDGPSISPEDSERVFLRGYRGNTPRKLGDKGQGLGLYLARLVLEAQGGMVYLDRNDQTRTRFVMELPLEY